MTDGRTLSFEEFLEAPLTEVSRVSPSTLILAAGGTRRSAALAGITGGDDAYARWSRQRMMGCFDLIFRHGVDNIITFAIINSQSQEITEGYRNRLTEWVDWGLSGSEALTEYARRNWRVRLLGAETIPGLRMTAERLIQRSPKQAKHSVWWFVFPDLESPWRILFEAVNRSKAKTRREAMIALYGEEIPAATLFLSFGKPMVSPALLPPLLFEMTQCYWSQRPSYEMDEEQFRAVLYDFAFQRETWRANKAGRAEAALDYREAWQKGPTLGLGTRLGPFWYPAGQHPPVARENKEGL